MAAIEEKSFGARFAAPSGIRHLIPHRRATAVIYSVAMFMNVMDAQIVNVALPRMAQDFHATIPSVQWVVTAYLMAIAVFVPMSGWLGDRFGSKRLFLIAIGAFAVASLLCATSLSLGELVAMRVLQGAGGGMMVPVGMSMLYRAYPPEERVNIARLITRVMVLAPATAPVIGGLLVTYASWRWIFTINVPVGAFAVIFGLLFLGEHKEPISGGFDIKGALCGGLGLGLLLYSVGSGPTLGWGSAPVIGSGLVSVVLLTSFVAIELRRPFPILNLHLLRDKLFRRCCSVLGFQTTAFFGSLLFTALYLQEGRGISPLNSGLSTFPEAVAIGLSSQLVARLFPRIGPRRLMTGGFVGLAIVTELLARSGATTSLWTIRALCFFLGAAVSFIILPNQAAVFTKIPSEGTGHASAIFNTLLRSLSSLGVALLSFVLAEAGGNVLHHRPPISAFQWVFTANVVIALIGAGFALRIPDSEAAAAMRAPPAPDNSVS
ncbi:MAG: MDR family MFS transporter [Acidimicrobiales bacterium]